MRPSDAAAKIKMYAGEINITLTMAKFREYSRMGLPGASFGDHRGSSEPPLPLMGKTDRQIELARSHYQQLLSDAALALEMARRIEVIWCVPLDTDAVKEEKLAPAAKGSGPCGNVWCSHDCSGKENDRLRKAPKRSGDDPAKDSVARCLACDRWWRRHGTERDPRERVVTSHHSAKVG